MPIAAIQQNSPHAALIADLTASDPEPAFERAMVQLASGGDLPLLLALAAAMARAGLAGMASALLQSTGKSVANHLQVRIMLEQLSRMPSGEEAPLVIEERYRRNVLRALATHPTLRNVVDENAPPSGVRFYRSRAGNMHCVRIADGSSLRTVFPFIDLRTQAASLTFPPPTLLTATLLLGMPSPHVLARLFDMNVQGYRPPIDVVETDVEVLRIWLCMLDRPELLDAQRLGLFVGDNAFSRYEEFLSNSPHRTGPTMILTNHRPGWQPPSIDASWRNRIDQRTRSIRTQSLARVESRLRDRHASYWRRRFRDCDKSTSCLKIVGFTSRYSSVVQHAMRDLASAFTRLGHQFTIAMQPDDCSANVDVAGTLAREDFDLIVTINHLRVEFPDSMPRNLPFVGWIQDHMDHLWKREAGASVGDLDLVVAHAPDVLCGLYGYPRNRMLASSNLTDPHTYSAEPLPHGVLEPYRCDLAFASHGAATPKQLVAELTASTSPAFGRLLDTALMILQTGLEREGCLNAQHLLEVMLEAEQASGHPALSPETRRSVVYPQIARIHDRLFRHQTLEWAAQWAESRGRTLRIYGRGWEHHPTLGRHAAGVVESGQPLRAAYQAATISLQANAYASLHQRLLDGIACGAMVVSRYNPADFVRQPFERIAAIIHEKRISTLAELAAMRITDAALAEACERAERLSGVVIRSNDHPHRREQQRVLREANNIAELLDDAGLFAMLNDQRFIPNRVASDLPGFDRTVFTTVTEMHALLDSLIDNAPERDSIVDRMRADVLQHDTFDALTTRIIAAFANGATL